MKETATHEASPASAGLGVTTAPRPNYGISLSPSGNHTFAEAIYGYAGQTAHRVAVSNVGNQATGALNIVLSGAHSSSFTLSKTEIANLAVGGREDFTVVPKTGLAAGDYAATVTVSGGNDVSATFNIGFKVNRAAQPVVPATPVLVSTTVTSVTLVEVEGAEYRNGDGAWQDSPTFDGLLPNTPYVFYTRIKETDTHEAGPVSAGLSVTIPEAEAELLGLSVNGTPVSVETEASEYIAGCDETSVVLEIHSSAYVKVNNADYTGQSISLNRDVTEISILLTSGDGTETYTHTLKIMRSIEAGSVLFQRWDDVISLIRNTNNNNGRTIDSVRWYRRDREELISTDWFIRITGEVTEYRAEIKVAGNWHNVCGLPRTRSESKIIAYPNPVSVGDNLTLQLPNDFVGGYVNVVTLSGTTVKQKLPLSGKLSHISVSDLSPGVYLLNVIGTNGSSETVKIIVNN
jgi:hypothetical protein